MNIAALWELPAMIVLEHNQYGLTVHHTQQSSITDLSLGGAGYGIPSKIVDGNDGIPDGGEGR
jgi:pyruvate dehydrogenase E1 component alpha subunit